MCFYSPVWSFNFFYLFALLSTLPYLDRHGNLFSLGSMYIFWKKMLSYFDCVYLYWKRALYKKPPLENSFLSTNWVPIEVKMKFLLKKVTQVILKPGVEACYPMSHISWVICNKMRSNYVTWTVDWGQVWRKSPYRLGNSKKNGHF